MTHGFAGDPKKVKKSVSSFINSTIRTQPLFITITHYQSAIKTQELVKKDYFLKKGQENPWRIGGKNVILQSNFIGRNKRQ